MSQATTTITSRQRFYGIGVLVFSTLLLTSFLFFIDEGYYDFRWMLDPGNWIVFIIYCMVLFAIQMLFFELVFRNYRGRGKLLLSLAGGIFAISLFLISIIFA